MSTKKFTGAGLAIGAATAVTAMLLGTTAAYAGSDGTESAFGISASGLVDIPETPYVESEDGEFEEKTEIDLSVAELGLTAKILNVTAQDGAADSEVVDFGLRDILTAKVIRTSCFDGDGGLEIVDLKLAGDDESLLRIPQEGLIKNEELDLGPLLNITFGEQTRNSDGTVTVTGIKIEVLPVTQAQLDDPILPDEADLLGGLLGTDLGDAPVLGDVLEQLDLGTDEPVQTVTIGSATCDEISDDEKKDDAEVIDHCDDGKNDDAKKDDEHSGEDVKKDDSSCDDDSTDSDDGDDDDSDDGGSAPAPTIVEASLPVTG